MCYLDIHLILANHTCFRDFILNLTVCAKVTSFGWLILPVD